MRTALAQLDHDTLTDDAGRVDATVAAIADAARRGADVVVLPELAGSGYVLDAEHLARVAEPVDGGPVVRAWRDACARHGVAAVAGFAERGDGNVYNSAVAIDATGELRGHYRKLHLFGREHDVFTPGDRGLPVFELAGVRVGIVVCYDLRFPESVRILALHGADVILVPTAWIGGFDPPDRAAGRQIGQIEAAVTHANLNQVFIACADLVGESGGDHFLGRSLVIDPYGDVVAGPLDPSEPGTIVADVDAGLARAAQERGPGISPRANRRTDVYDALLGYQPPIGQEPTT